MMLYRIKLTVGEKTIAVTSLTAKVLFPGVPQINRQKEETATLPEVSKELGQPFAVVNKEFLIRRWNELTSDELLEKLNELSDSGPENGKEQQSAALQSEHFLLQTLAEEKKIFPDYTLLFEKYIQCRGGRFGLAMILNNLGVLEARKGECEIGRAS